MTIVNLNFFSKKDHVNLFGYDITNSFFYTSDSKNSDVSFAINTKLSITVPNGVYDYKERYFEYVTINYNDMTNKQRGYYIKWLADGKPYTYQSEFVTLYLCGLEYRALKEKENLKEILFELIDLLSQYNRLNNGKFQLIVYLVYNIQDFSEIEKDKILKFFINNKSHFLPYTIYNVTFNAPIFNSILNHLTPIKTKEDINFSSLYADLCFSSIFFGDRKSELISYYMDEVIKNIDIKDIYVLKKSIFTYFPILSFRYLPSRYEVKFNNILPSKKLKNIWIYAANLIASKVTPYVMPFNYSTDKPLSKIEKLAYLPKELRDQISISYDDFDFGDKAFVDVKTIINKLNLDEIPKKINLRQSILLGNICKVYGYEIEPDAGIDTKIYRNDAKILICKNQYPNEDISPYYVIASSFFELGYAIALSDGEISKKEIEYIDDYILNNFDLCQREINHLKMKKAVILSTTKRISTKELVNRIIRAIHSEEFSMDEEFIIQEKYGKHAIADFAMNIAIADGVLWECEIKILRKIFDILHFLQSYLTDSLTKLLKETDKVVNVLKGKPKKKGSKIPKDIIQLYEHVELNLDDKKLERIKTDTSEVQDVLQEIFSDDEQEKALEDVKIKKNTSVAKSKQGENDGLLQIINIIIEKDCLTRKELLNIIKDTGKMLNSLVDEINGWAEENFGDFLIEEGDADIYTINIDVINLIKDE